MILEHTTHAGYIRQDDVYTDENGVNYTVCQDTNAGDPRSWLSHEEAAIVAINADRNTRTDNIDDYDDNPAILSLQPSRKVTVPLVTTLTPLPHGLVVTCGQCRPIIPITTHCAASTPMIPKVLSSTTSRTTFLMSYLS